MLTCDDTYSRIKAMKNYKKNVERPNKTRVQRGVFKILSEMHKLYDNEPKVYRTYLCLPSTTPHKGCVQQLFEEGLIDHNTNIIGIEGGDSLEKAGPNIKARLSRMGFKKNALINKKICDIGLHDIYSAMHSIEKKHGQNAIYPIDLVYLDTCSILNSDMQKFIDDVLMTPHAAVTKDATIITNFVGTMRTFKEDVQKYNNTSALSLATGSIKPANDNAVNVSRCLYEKLGRITDMCVSYKEPGKKSSMILSVNKTRVSQLNLDHQEKIRERVDMLQNTGYNGEA